MNPSMPPLGQSLVFGGVFVATALCTDTLYVLTAAAVAGKLRRRAASRRYGKYLAATSFIGLGIYAALTNPRGSR